MTYLLVIILIVLLVQLMLSFSIRSKKELTGYPPNLQQKYHIKTRADAWRLLNNPELPEAEKIQIEDLYKHMK